MSFLDEITIERECQLAEDTAEMVIEVDNYTRSLYSPENIYGFKPNQLEHPKIHFMVVRKDGQPIACAGIKIYDEDENDQYTEVKRMYVRQGYRGKGLAKHLLKVLEELSLSLGFPVVRLETGIHQPDAISLYQKVGYKSRGVFGDYRESTENVFFEKILN